MPDPNIRRDEKLLCGRLIAMPTTGTTNNRTVVRNNLDTDKQMGNIISVDFPAMPDTIELARSADYLVNYNIVMPDGIHQYKGTKPMEIPVSFRLHSLDKQYCKKGALTLLQLAARLHSFILPISTFGQGAMGVPVLTPGELDAERTGKPIDAELAARAESNRVFQVVGAGGSKNGSLYNPITVWLHLMWTGDGQPGISAIGYLREVSVKFNGPWLRGPNSSFNLPTSADFSFTFIHRPGHANSQNFSTSQNPPTVAQSGQAYADDVKDLLYNTRALVNAANYQGFNTQPGNLSGD